jgi:hypothetical protein
MIVAWHKVPGATPPKRSRPVGDGVIRAGVRAGSMIGVMKISNTKTDYLVLKNQAHISTEILHELGLPIHTVPYGTVLCGTLFQALCAWLQSCCPSGTKYILPWEASLS